MAMSGRPEVDRTVVAQSMRKHVLHIKAEEVNVASPPQTGKFRC